MTATNGATNGKFMYNTLDSPFIELQTPVTAWEVIKMAVMLPTIPFRLALLVFAVFGVAITNTIATYGCDMSKPLPRWRRRMVELSSSFWCGTMLFAAGFWWPRIKGWEHWEEAKRIGAIGVFNHVSYIDAFVVTWSLCAAGLTFKFTEHVPVLGLGIRALQNLLLPTDKSKQTISMVDAIRKRATTPGMPPLVIAPEGTLSHGRCLLTFKTGAFVPGLPVVPILLKYKLTGHNVGWGVINPKMHLFRIFSQLYNHVEVECLPIYRPSEEERANPQLYAANVRQLMAEALGVPLVDEDRTISQALEIAGIRPSLDGRRVVSLRKDVVIGADGHVDLTRFVEKAEGKAGKKEQ